MQLIIIEFIVQTLVVGLGTLIKKLFGIPPSTSGIGEMWIGSSVIVGGLVIFIALMR